MIDTAAPHHRFVGPGIGLVSLSLMSAEIMLTRLFSVVLWYHFAFFAISVALLGLGAGAVLVQALQHRLPARHTAGLLSGAALMLALAILGLDAGLLRVDADWFGSGAGALFTTMSPRLLALFLLTTLPFLLGGFVLSLAFVRFGEAIHRLYAWDLLGAGLACAMVIPLLDRLGGPHALLVSSGLAGAAAVVFALHGGGIRRGAVAAAGALGVVALGVAAAATGALDIRVAKGLDLEQTPPEFQRWNSFSAVSVFPFWPFQGWGLSPSYEGPVPPQKGLVIDMNAFTPLTPFDGDFGKVAHTRYDLSAFAFQLKPGAARVCVVGAGGGKDVLAALAAGSRHVTGVEVNPLIVEDVMRERYAEFTGGLYLRPDVEVHVEDGRSFLRRERERYDVVLISMVDTSAATAAGAFALAENTLYTRDAFRDFLARLTPDGVLTVASVSLEGLAVGARLSSVARAALRDLGASSQRSVVVLRTPWLAMAEATMYNLVVKPSGFSAQELALVGQRARELGFGVAYPSYLAGDAAEATPAAVQREDQFIARILGATSEGALRAEMASWPLDLSPVTDDRPFFFYQNRLRDLGAALFAPSPGHLYGNGLVILVKVLFAAVLMVALLIGLPLWWAARRRAGEDSASVRAPGERARLGVDLSYVGFVGLAFMFVEIGAIQRVLPYLGQPTYTLTAVLLVLLVGGGLGSRFSAALSARGVARCLLALLVYGAAWVFAWPLLAETSLHLSSTARALIVGASLLPLGLLLGVPLPSGLARARGRDPLRIPWLWGINSATSVLGSIVATMASMHGGITLTLCLGLAGYAGAALLWSRG